MIAVLTRWWLLAEFVNDTPRTLPQIYVYENLPRQLVAIMTAFNRDFSFSFLLYTQTQVKPTIRTKQGSINLIKLNDKIIPIYQPHLLPQTMGPVRPKPKPKPPTKPYKACSGASIIHYIACTNKAMVTCEVPITEFPKPVKPKPKPPPHPPLKPRQHGLTMAINKATITCEIPITEVPKPIKPKPKPPPHPPLRP